MLSRKSRPPLLESSWILPIAWTQVMCVSKEKWMSLYRTLGEAALSSFLQRILCPVRAIDGFLFYVFFVILFISFRRGFSTVFLCGIALYQAVCVSSWCFFIGPLGAVSSGYSVGNVVSSLFSFSGCVTFICCLLICLIGSYSNSLWVLEICFSLELIYQNMKANESFWFWHVLIIATTRK